MDERPCPFCGETIQAVAIVCRFCLRDVSASYRADARPDKAGVLTREVPPLVTMLLIGGFILTATLTAPLWLRLLPGSGGAARSAAARSSETITLAQYERLRKGMHYSQAVAIIGREGTEVAQTQTDAPPSDSVRVSTKLYSWQNASGSYANALFQNDLLITSSQSGLR